MTTPDQVGVVITLPQIYTEVQAMAKTLSQVDSTLTAFRTETNAKFAETAGKLTDHETRIRADEATRWPRATVVAIATVVAAVAGIGALFITH